MSAFDLAGAVVWTSLAAFLLGVVVLALSDGKPLTDAQINGGGVALLGGFAALAASVYCIGRLFGAHA